MTLWCTVAILWCHKLCAVFWTTLYIYLFSPTHTQDSRQHCMILYGSWCSVAMRIPTYILTSLWYKAIIYLTISYGSSSKCSSSSSSSSSKLKQDLVSHHGMIQVSGWLPSQPHPGCTVQPTTCYQVHRHCQRQYGPTHDCCQTQHHQYYQPLQIRLRHCSSFSHGPQALPAPGTRQIYMFICQARQPCKTT